MLSTFLSSFFLGGWGVDEIRRDVPPSHSRGGDPCTLYPLSRSHSALLFNSRLIQYFMLPCAIYNIDDVGVIKFFRYMNASVGVSSQICTAHDATTAITDGVDVTLFMTIQPAKCPENGKATVWRVCSWQPDVSFCGEDIDCCNYVGDSLDAEKHGHLVEESCQDFEEGDCNQFLGFDGEGPQLFAVKLQRCNGETPVDPSCKQNTGELRLSDTKLANSGAGRSATPHANGWSAAAALVGCGAVLLSVSMYLRRKRLAHQSPQDQYAAYQNFRSPASREPSERSPIWKAEMSCASLDAARLRVDETATFFSDGRGHKNVVNAEDEKDGDKAGAENVPEDECQWIFPADLNRLRLLHHHDHENSTVHI